MLLPVVSPYGASIWGGPRHCMQQASIVAAEAPDKAIPEGEFWGFD